MTTLTVLRVTIELDGPWLVGDPTGFGEVDTAPLRDYDDRPQVPATSLAGSLRSHLVGRPDIDAAAWMGEVRRGEEDHSGTPSRLRVLGVRLTGGEHTATRTSTAVDAATGSALPKTLRREEYVDAKTTLGVYLLHDGAMHQPLLDTLASWRPVIGRRRTNGWGRASVTELKRSTVDLSDPEQLVSWLCGGGPEQIDQLLAEAPTSPIEAPADQRNLLRVRFRVPVGVHIGTGALARTDAQGDDEHRVMPVADIVSRNGAPYVPASSWRGVLRGHAAFVLRSLGCPRVAAQRAVEAVFGGVAQRGLLTFHDSELNGDNGGAGFQEEFQHVGIDRVTGGARANLLFADRAAAGTVELRVSAERPDQVPGWANTILGHTVRDLADGFLAIGGRTTRGLGTLELVEEPTARVPEARGVDIAEVMASTLEDN